MNPLLAALAMAHQPWIAEEGQYADAAGAFPMEDIDLSIVVYDELSCSSPALWLRFSAQEGDSLWAQLGMPLLDRQVAWRPAMAVLAAGMPEADDRFPFAVPEGLGVTVLDSAEVADPEVFVEPFTGTSSWILRGETLSLPAGEGYLVAWDPAGLTGKLWLAPGLREEFESEDIERIREILDDVRTFHELDGAAEGALAACATPEEEELETGDAPGSSGDAATGCSTPPATPTGGGALLAALAGLWTARRARLEARWSDAVCP